MKLFLFLRSVQILMAFHVISLFFLTILTTQTNAQQCMPQRVINQYRCKQSPDDCALHKATKQTPGPFCEATGDSVATAISNCETNCGGGLLSCGNQAPCIQWNVSQYSCEKTDFNANCSAAPACNAFVNLINCSSSGASCSENTQDLTYECWNNNITVPDDPGGCGTGSSCILGVASCGEVGQDNGAGSCTGGLCCKPQSNYNPNCSYNIGQTDYPGYAPDADCRFSEGGGCHARCQPPIAAPGSYCAGCADGLVGGGCLCPSCTTRFSPKKVTVSPGGTIDVDIINKPTNWKRSKVMYPISNPADDRDPNLDVRYIFKYFDNDSTTSVNVSTVANARLRANNNQIRIDAGATPGSTRIQVQMRYLGYDTRTLCTSNINVAVAYPPLLPCTVSSVTIASSSCAHSQTGGGSITAQWSAVAGVTQYLVQMINTNGDSVASRTDTDVNFGCGDGTCEYTANTLPGGTSYTANVTPVASAINTCDISGAPTTTSNPATPIAFCPASMQAKGKVVASPSAVCAEVEAGAAVTPLTLSLPGSTPQTQTIPSGSNNYAVWNNTVPAGTNTTPNTIPPVGNVRATACWSKTGTAGSFQANGSPNLQSTETVYWQIGFTPGTPWSRVMGGDATICQRIISYVPTTINPRTFMTSPSGGSQTSPTPTTAPTPTTTPVPTNTPTPTPGFVPVPEPTEGGGDIQGSVRAPLALYGNGQTLGVTTDGADVGIVTYGVDYDFDPDVSGNGGNFVSPTNWLVNEAPSFICTTPWHTYFFNKFGLSGVSVDYTNPTPMALSDFTSRTKPYSIAGDLNITGGTIDNNTSRVIFVENNLTISGPITFSPGAKGFLAFIVKGNIIVDPSVGGLATSNNPQIEGVFITNGQFKTGYGNVGKEKLIISGTVIANDVVLERNLASVNGNNTQPAEEFRYNPMFLFTMPNELMDMKINWQEVAP